MIVPFSLVILGFKITNAQHQLDISAEKQNQIQLLLSGENRAMGYTCGVLTKNKAEELLQSEVLVEYIQGPTDIIQVGKAPQASLFWTDNCRYEDSKDNSKYVEFYVSTFASKEAAAKAFPDFFNIVNDNLQIPSESYGKELVYDGGVFYLLRTNKVIQVSASNGTPSMQKEFSQNVFKTIINSFSQE
jgi:phosphopantetheinyl transferase (holo-ACP synthase)